MLNFLKIMYKQSTKWTTAKKTNFQGNIYDSKFEAGKAYELEMMKRAKQIKDWERQVNIPLIVNGYKICVYIIDYIVHHNNGVTEYIEMKGYSTEVWKLKWKLFEALFSEKEDVLLTVEFQGKGKIPHPKKIIEF